MKRSRRHSGALLRATVGLYARADLTFERLQQAVGAGVEGLLGNALTNAEKDDLTIALYNARAVQQGPTLTPWESRWFAEVLPAAPARLLLAAAGSGRELLPLCAAGYTVDAFEPAQEHARELAERAKGCAWAARGSFADLVSAVLDRETNALSELAQRRYDAVILGWGSLTHVLEIEAQRSLLRACDRLVGDGPILASFWNARAEPRSRARTLGAALGQKLAAMRGIASDMPAGQTFRSHCGFAHHFSRSEIEALAEDCGRTVQWGTEGYPHVTLLR